MNSRKISVLGFIESMAEKFHSARDVADGGLCLIDFEFLASFDEPSDALQRPLGRSDLHTITRSSAYLANR